MNNNKNRANKVSLILWSGILLPGHEACRMFFQKTQWHLEGKAIFTFEKEPCLLDYHIICDRDWLTLSAKVEGWVGDEIIALHLIVDQNRHWWLNESEVPGVAGCTDLDLNFSPSTNTIAIRRLKLAIGEKKEISAAWLRFPNFTLEPLAQSYQRLDRNLFRYESNHGSFVADLMVNEAGLVADYPGIWKIETGSG